MVGTNFQKLIGIFTPEFDEIYTAIRDLKNCYRIDLAKGKSLDKIGIFLEFNRAFNEYDVDYRNHLYDVVHVNSITGTKYAIRELLSDYLRVDISGVQIFELAPNKIIVQCPPSTESREQELYPILERCVAAGVVVYLEFSGTYWDQDCPWDDIKSIWG
jgi:predicted TIM-barrel fold metal-dependent hydrolase